MKLIQNAAVASMLLMSASAFTTATADPLAFTNPFSSGNGSTSSSNPVYFGGSLGSTSVDSFCTGLANCDDSDMGWKVFAGYDFSERLAVEVGYNALGEVQGANKRSKISGYEFAAVGKMPLNDQIGLFGKAGMFRWEAKNDDGKRSSFDVLFGGGIEYKMNGNISLRGEWERFNDVETKSNETSDIDFLSLGFTYRTL